ncbi:MAG: DNA cytosine methyltransferase [Candidatus Bathyarchaeota archaeon]|nr:DNA cytosine methyltransferase [Candidatus Termiticorpusculum sp.]
MNNTQVRELFWGIRGFRYSLKQTACQHKTIYTNKWNKWATSNYYLYRNKKPSKIDAKTLEKRKGGNCNNNSSSSVILI